MAQIDEITQQEESTFTPISSGSFTPIEKFSSHVAVAGDSMGLPATLIHGAVATLADVGTTLWNSVTPTAINYSTEDLLSRIDQDALQVYNEHPDAIHTASFIGGLVAPIGLAAKGMGMLRNGARGASWFTTAGQMSVRKAVEEAFVAGGTSQSFKAAKFSLYKGMALNAVADNVAAEAAIAFTMSAHPYMEDYYKDFSSNFLKSVAFGAGIQGGIGSIITKREIANIVSPRQETALGIIKNTLRKPLEEAKISALSNIGEEAAIRLQGLEKLEGIIVEAEKTSSLEPVVIDFLKASLLKESESVTLLVKGSATGQLAEHLEVAGADVLDNFKSFISKPQNAGLDKVAFAEVTKEIDVLAKGKGLQEAPSLIKTVTGRKINAGEKRLESTSSIYLPHLDSYVGKEEASKFLTAADLGKTGKELTMDIKSTFSKDPRLNWHNDVGITHTALADADHIKTMLHYAELSPQQLNKAIISTTDLPSLKAAYMKASTAEERFSLTLKNTKGQEKVISSLDELGEVIARTQQAITEDLKFAGYGAETIALHTGTDVDTTLQLLTKLKDPMEVAGLIKYSSQEVIDRALATEARALELSTNINKAVQPSVKAAMNARTMDLTSKGLLEFNMLSSPSEIVRDLGLKLFSDNTKTMVSRLGSEIERITPALMKNSLWASSNQVLEAFGDIGPIAGTIGKDIIKLTTDTTIKFEKPIRDVMSAIIKKGTAHQIEANAAITFNAALSGKRIWKNNTFWQIDSKMGTKEVSALLKLDDTAFSALNKEELGISQAVGTDGRVFTAATEEVNKLMTELQTYGREIYQLKNSYVTALGKHSITDNGFWIPAFSPKDKEVAYVIDHNTKTTSMLYANSEAELISGMDAYKKALIAKNGDMAGIQIIPKGQQEAFNTLAGRHDSFYMGTADVGMKHSGSGASAVVATDTRLFNDILSGYNYHLNNGIENVASIHMNDIMNSLKDLSEMSKGLYQDATLGKLQKLIRKPVDAGNIARNILLGKPAITEHTLWSEMQTPITAATDILFKGMSDVLSPMLGGAKKRTPEEWAKVVDDMKKLGIVNPFSAIHDSLGIDTFLKEGGSNSGSLTPRIVALSNGLAATLILRAGDMAQAAINVMSLPILTSAAVRRRLASSFDGTAVDPLAKFSVTSAFHDGIRMMNHPTLGKHWADIAKEKGLLNVDLRDVTELIEFRRTLDPGALTKLEEALTSKVVEVLAKPADLSERMVKGMTFYTGIAMAKKAYPGISDVGAYAFARNFMDESMGNYLSAQRPAIFQGSVGVAMGLFQTYFMTLAQSMYRQIEHRDWASLGKMLLTQSTVFGANSLPGFHVVSEQIGKSFSDQHVDLETGTLRAVASPLDNAILYGLPASFGFGFTTRGDIQPRLPNPMEGANSLPAVNLVQQAYTAMDRLVGAAFTADANTGRAMLEALSLQSINRPIARVSELIAGQSITSSGDIVDSGANMYTTAGVISRIMGTRPIEEVKAREAFHLRTVYGQADRANKKEATFALKSYARNDMIDSPSVDDIAEKYLRAGGTSAGWRRAINDAVQQTGESASTINMDKLRPESPLNRLIDDM